VLLPLLLAASLLPAQMTSMKCVDTGANIATAQTQPLRGPSGVAAVLKASSSDDYSKDSHGCSAEYRLILVPATGGTPIAVDLLTTDDDYGRSLSLHLDGFSQDGKRVFGTFSEGGKHPFTMLFIYDAPNGKVQLVDLTKQFIGAAECNTAFVVIGTAADGAIALELDSAGKCVPTRRYLLDPSGRKSQPFS
jgi:hypothetical protein